ncbi:hypothetical protein FCH28_14335 [Streptomyces piniterrae]|uniref:DUF4404 family protein n=1 Tax=Streptomyces piniterrae TaxID=2571125 RepID=A0A4U0NJG1_9ACTN|nr:hypothetical protein [Streptomyces piniterrae]TJZ54330.1 hypothetical protein FCH28_14335 [Streptomyces piniterrae]
MGTYHFHGGVSGVQNSFGDHNQNLLVANLDELVERVRAEQPAQTSEAEQLRDELVLAATQNRPVDQSRTREWLTTIREGAGASSGVLTLVTSLTALLGL